VVDAISAEDIGKFPDTNLAESLQRITGISISRNNGEGSQVTARPFQASDNGITASVGAKALHDTTNRVGDDVTPEVSGFINY
ncbi:TonB-dependent receptor plug domain-containing protein, partial [Alteromonas macleodii]|uniref:TonB-dependent receptor plug domain-containing protein n=1 Tax=Alteromonas macleodii TaxID=28108 RepID=UPI003F5CD876